MMKLFIFMMMISSSSGNFYGCPMDGCESTLSGYVDIPIDGYRGDVKWQRTDLLNNASRGCVSNGLFGIICAVDAGYVSINVTNGQLLWLLPLEIEEETVTVSLPIINYQGFSIIANGTRCTLIEPQGEIGGTFEYIPNLIAPLAGPIVTDDGQIIVADLTSVSFTKNINRYFQIVDRVEHIPIDHDNFDEPLKFLVSCQWWIRDRFNL